MLWLYIFLIETSGISILHSEIGKMKSLSSLAKPNQSRINAECDLTPFKFVWYYTS